MKHKHRLLGTEFSADESLILTWSEDGMVHLWDFGVDYDFPSEHLPLQVEVMTGTIMNDYGAVKTLSAEEWKRKHAKKQNGFRTGLTRWKGQLCSSPRTSMPDHPWAVCSKTSVEISQRPCISTPMRRKYRMAIPTPFSMV
uniref:Uncharacterized protein n=1 Tax=Candidatus Kentrum sp. FW TaxID=2126338 RepID=A0A450TZM0_9GAMM|nr:MAG: hypothetical protein BECKFW1821C_GA0114237_107911 [Candidatus Kentron sp. FW]